MYDKKTEQNDHKYRFLDNPETLLVEEENTIYEVDLACAKRCGIKISTHDSSQ